MSFFEGQTPSWQHRRQQSWNPQQASSTPSSQNQTTLVEEHSAFASQYEEIIRATENLAKSGRVSGSHTRSESMPYSGTFVRQYPEIGNSRIASSPHKYSFGREFEGIRSPSNHPGSNLQGYIAHQRYGPRLSDTDQVLQAKRRAAAQRERELRNYHQEQQYNRNLPTAKSERSMSPGSMNEDDRRELIARQHRALYGSDSNLYGVEANTGHPASQDVRVMAATPGTQNATSMPLERLGINNMASANEKTTTTITTNTTTTGGSGIGGSQHSRANSTTPPTGVSSAYSTFESTSQQPNRASSSSPRASPTRQVSKLASGGLPGVAPIGTRPAATTGTSKRSSPPQSMNAYHPQKSNTTSTERSSSATSNTPGTSAEKGVALGWNGSNGPWGPNKSGNFGGSVQASVWG